MDQMRELFRIVLHRNIIKKDVTGWIRLSKKQISEVEQIFVRVAV